MNTHAQTELPPQPERRGFLARLAALVAGGAAALVPMGAGLMTLFDPLRRSAQSTGFVRVTTLSALPDDGVPRKFPVIADRQDAWNKIPRVPIGAVYLRRAGQSVTALNVVCPHAGCFVDFVPVRGGYLCPCHDSTFALDGRVKDSRSPSPRGLDALEVEIRNQTEVWVKFQNFRAGTHEKILAS
jgi:Rieske Fe-S protein